MKGLISSLTVTLQKSWIELNSLQLETMSKHITFQEIKI